METKIWTPQSSVTLKVVDTPEGQIRAMELARSLVASLPDLRAQAYSGQPCTLSNTLREQGYTLTMEFFENVAIGSHTFMVFLRLRPYQADAMPPVELDVQTLADTEEGAWESFERALRKS